MPSTMTRSLALAAASALFGCAAPAGPPPAVPPSALEMAQFWVEPADLPQRDLFAGPWGAEHAPDPAATYVFEEKKKQGMISGFSPGYTVRGPGDIEWSAKQGPEAQAEVTASRLVWALGFHQPPVYFLEKWTLSGGTNPGEQTRARFRPEIKKELDKVGEWGWLSNPFRATEAHRGLLVMMIMLNNSDLKSAQNAIYDLKRPREGAQRWYVVRDLGHSFGETGKFRADRNDIVEFETEAFTKGRLERQGEVQLVGVPQGAGLRPDPRRRALDLRAAGTAQRPPVAGRLPCRRLRSGAGRALHPALQAEDRGGAGAPVKP